MDLGLKRVKVGSGDCAVVFVHGILSDGERCWKHENGSYWPELLAAADPRGILSIFVYTYESDIFSADYNLDDVVDDLRQRLRDAEAEAEDFLRIVFVCHSMGGIVVRRYLVRRQLDISAGEGETTFGLLLVASPSLGSDWANWLKPIAQFFRHSQADALRFSKTNPWLDGLNRDFQDLKESGKLELRGRELIEDKFIVLHKFYFFFFRKVVERISAARYFGEALKIAGSDHFSIAKPKDADALQHKVLCELIANVVPDFDVTSIGCGRAYSNQNASGRKFAVGVARLEGDEDRQEFKKLVRAMQDFFEGIEVYEDPSTIRLKRGNQDAALTAGHAEARRRLREAGIDAFLWGEVLSDGTEKQLRLHWTVPEAAGSAKSTERYESVGNFDLPRLFWEDVSITLGTVVTAAAAEIFGAEGRFIADRLKDLLPKIERLLGTTRLHESESGWVQVARAHARAAVIYGQQAGDNSALVQAVSTYQHIFTLEKVPLDRAATQNNLGIALRILGERENGTERLEAAVHAFKEALKEHAREKGPLSLSWARTQNNLGNALVTLGERESENGTERLEAAVHAYEEALKVRTREKVPLDWAGTKNNLGNALAALGERENGTERLEAAVLAFEEALKERTREKVPLDWAGTQDNLGIALTALGKREKGTKRLEAAVLAFKEALEERTREKVPLDWAMTQNNFGIAIRVIGERLDNLEMIRSAISKFDAALRIAQSGNFSYIADGIQRELNHTYECLKAASVRVRRTNGLEHRTD